MRHKLAYSILKYISLINDYCILFQIQSRFGEGRAIISTDGDLVYWHVNVYDTC